MPDVFKPQRGKRSIVNKSTKVLEKDEILLVLPDETDQIKRGEIRVGNGIDEARNIEPLIDGKNADKLVISEITTSSEKYPSISAGDDMSVVSGKLNKQQEYINTQTGMERLPELIQVLGSIPHEDFVGVMTLLNDIKLNKSSVYDGTDSTSKVLPASSNSVRIVNEKTDNNVNAISELNRNLGNKTLPQNTDNDVRIVTPSNAAGESATFYMTKAGKLSSQTFVNGTAQTWYDYVTKSEFTMTDFDNAKFYLYNNNQELVLEFSRGSEKYQITFTRSNVIYRYYSGTAWETIWTK